MALALQPSTKTLSPRPQAPDRSPQRANQPARYLQLVLGARACAGHGRDRTPRAGWRDGQQLGAFSVTRLVRCRDLDVEPAAFAASAAARLQRCAPVGAVAVLPFACGLRLSPPPFAHVRPPVASWPGPRTRQARGRRTW